MSTEPSVRLDVDLGQQCRLNTEEDMCPSPSSREDADTLSQALKDRYRCPDSFFDLIVSEHLPSDAGYFRFGPDAICYGRSCSGKLRPRPESALYDALRDVTVDGKSFACPSIPQR